MPIYIYARVPWLVISLRPPIPQGRKERLACLGASVTGYRGRGKETHNSVTGPQESHLCASRGALDSLKYLAEPMQAQKSQADLSLPRPLVQVTAPCPPLVTVQGGTRYSELVG